MRKLALLLSLVFTVTLAACSLTKTEEGAEATPAATTEVAPAVTAPAATTETTPAVTAPAAATTTAPAAATTPAATTETK